VSRFQIGDCVRIDARSETRHHRVPAYVKGQRGKVVRVCHSQGKPEELAAGDVDGVRVPVYRVRLCQSALWSNYVGGDGDTLDIEIYEHWLLDD